MAAALVVCGKCRRHIRESDRTCPFCASSRTGRMVTAAALSATVALSACGASTTAGTTPLPQPAPATPAAVSPPATVADVPAPPASASADSTPPATPTGSAAETAPPAGSYTTVEVSASGVYGPPPRPVVQLGNAGPSTAYGPPPGATPAPADTGWVQVTKAEVDGAMAMQDVLRVVRQHSDRMRTCYQAGLRDNPNKTSWTASVSFRISEMGRVIGPHVDGGDIPGAEATACLTAITASMAFPLPPRGSSLVNARYEVTFAPHPVKPPQPHF